MAADTKDQALDLVAAIGMRAALTRSDSERDLSFA